MLSLYLMMVLPLARYQCEAIEWPEVYTGLIQGLYDEAGCELPVVCSWKNVSDNGYCCYDCTGCVDIHCRGHWQCCRKDRTAMQTNLPNFNEYTTCQKVFVKANGDSSTTKSVSYDMITTCPDNAPRTLQEMCVNNAKESVINEIPLFDTNYIGLMYRNRYCFQCHQLLTDFSAEYPPLNAIPFNLALTRRPVRHYHQFKSLKIFSKSNFTKFDLANINTKDTLVLFATLDGTEAARVEPKAPCDLTLDLILCNDQNKPWTLRQACSKFDSPIRVINSTSKQEYLAKNLACARCVLGDEIAISSSDIGKKQCRLAMQTEPWLLINPLLLNDDKDNFTGIRNFSILDSTCPNGFFRDKVNKKCRAVMCPRHHFISQGQCHPVFTHSVGQCYHIKVKITVKSQINSAETIFRIGKNAFSNMINTRNDFVLNKLRGHVRYYSRFTSMFASSMSMSYIIFEMSFTPPAGMTYKHIHDNVAPLVKPGYKRVGVSEGMQYDISAADDVSWVDNSGKVIELSSKIQLYSPTKYEWSHNSLSHCEAPIRITYLDVCDMVHMSHSDFLTRNSRMNDEYWERIDDDTVAVCMDKLDNAVIVVPDNDWNVNNDDKDTTDKKDDDTGVFGLTEIIIIILCTGLILLIVCIAWPTHYEEEEMEEVTESGGPDENGEKRTKKRRKLTTLHDVGLL